MILRQSKYTTLAVTALLLLLTVNAFSFQKQSVNGWRRETQRTGRCSMTIPAIFDHVSPAVVYIFATSVNPYRRNDRVEHVVGSGFIIDSSGLILTNSHVAFGRQSIVVRLADETIQPAQLV